MESKIVKVEDGIIEGFTILDVGDQTLNKYAEALGNNKNGTSCKTIVWNGPLGYTEAKKFAKGTQSIAKYIANNTNAECVIGGGDSVAAINKIKKEALENKEDMKPFDRIYLSTGGGASLEFLEGKELPGISAIQDVKK